MSTLLVVDDEPAILHAFRRVFVAPQVRLLTAESAREGIRLVREHRPDVVVLDVRLPDESGLDVFHRINAIDAGIPVLFITGHGTTDTAIEAIKNGALDYLFKPLDIHKLREAVETAFEVPRATRASGQDEKGLAQGMPDEAMIGRCEAMQEVYKSIGRLAPQNIPVLILGESGTGKELVARALWRHSRRSQEMFLPVNCAAIADSLIESELFGHEKGAFTGADRTRIGKFEQCRGGTLFLDEIGEMTAAAQAKILRVLQEQRFERVGGEQTIETDVRLIAATNRREEHLLSHQRLRGDLYYRLSVSSIRLPALRDRGDDLELLTRYFLDRFRQELGKQEVSTIAESTMALLKEYAWPGNVRQLQSAIKRALLNAAGPTLLPEFLPQKLRRPQASMASEADATEMLDDLDRLILAELASGEENLYSRMLEVMERQLIRRVLEHTGGSQAQAARRLGISRGTLRSKMRALGIKVEQCGWRGDVRS